MHEFAVSLFSRALQAIASLLAQAKIVNQGTTGTLHALISESASHKAHTVFRPNAKVQQDIHLNCNAAHTSTVPGVVQHTALQTRRSRENCWFYIQNPYRSRTNVFYCRKINPSICLANIYIGNVVLVYAFTVGLDVNCP